MPYSWSKKSLGLLECLHPDMRRVVDLVMSWQVMDLTVVRTKTTPELQAEKVKGGFSKTLNSKHLTDAHGFAGAVDLAPYPVDWKDEKRFGVLMGLMIAAAKVQGVQVRVGGNWDGDNDFHDNTPEDPGHFELVNFRPA